MWVKLLVLVVLFNLSAFFSGSETAFFSIDEVSARGVGGESVLDRLMMRLLNSKEKLLSTVLLGNEVVNVAISSITASLFMDAFGERWVGASVFVTTLFLLIYGELVPKVVAVRYNRTWALLAAPLLVVFSVVLAPVRILLEGVSKGVSAIVGKEDTSIGEADFKAIVDEARSRGVLEERERSMIYSVFRFSDLQVREIMVPEPDIFMVDVNEPLDRLKEEVKRHRFSKIPVYEGERDNVVGYIRITDLLPVFKGLCDRGIRDLVLPCYFVPETKPVRELLKEFQSKRIDMALVVNEYGALEGLVTLEDILEELVGEIWDEYDQERKLIVEDGGGYLVDALCPVDEFSSLVGVEVPEDAQVDTVGGLVLHLFGRIPRVGEELLWEGLRFRVVEMSGRRIRRVRVDRYEVSGD